MRKCLSKLETSLISSCTAQLSRCCCNHTANMLYYILSMTNNFSVMWCVSEDFVLLNLCLCLCFPFLGYMMFFVVFDVSYVSVILSKFQPAMVLLSGLIFTCPVPSPAVTLRVKSTVLREFTQTTKVCEQKEKSNYTNDSPPASACLHVGWVACVMWPSSLLERCHPTWMIQLSESQQMHFIVTFPTISIWILAADCC